MPDFTDPLQSLVIEDVQSVDRNRLASFLQPFARFDKNKKVNFLPAFESIITNETKLEVVLIASKARSLYFEEPEGLSPSEIINLEIMPPGSVKSSLKKLHDMRKIKKDSNGKYFLPNYRISDVIDKIGKADGE